MYRPNGCAGAVDKPLLSHQRSISDLTTSYSPFRPNAQAGQWGQADADRWQGAPSRSRAADHYRQSIASLTYVAEQDPAALEEVMRVYASSHGSEGDLDDVSGGRSGTTGLEPDSQDGEADGDCSGPEAASMDRSVSSQSARAVKQAQKLAQVLGTTKGEVSWPFPPFSGVLSCFGGTATDGSNALWWRRSGSFYSPIWKPPSWTTKPSTTRTGDRCCTSSISSGGQSPSLDRVRLERRACNTFSSDSHGLCRLPSVVRAGRKAVEWPPDRRPLAPYSRSPVPSCRNGCITLSALLESRHVLP